MQSHLIENLLAKVGDCPAGNLETQTLEFKGWCRDEKELSQKVSEAAVCLAQHRWWTRNRWC